MRDKDIGIRSKARRRAGDQGNRALFIASRSRIHYLILVIVVSGQSQSIIQIFTRCKTGEDENVTLPDVRPCVYVGSGSRICRRTIIIRPRERSHSAIAGREIIRFSVLKADRLFIDRPRSTRTCQSIVRSQTAVCAVAADRYAIYAVRCDRIGNDANVRRSKVVRNRTVAQIERRRRIKPRHGISKGDGFDPFNTVDLKRPALRRAVVSEGNSLGPSCRKNLRRDRPTTAL